MITERQKLILKLIVEEYVKTNQPVGSMTLLQRNDIDVSPATIRNEMAALENEGYLEKTHTSSGRVPSEKGYRLYVQLIMGDKKKKKHNFPLIDEIFEKDALNQEEAIKDSVMLVSQLTNYAAVVLDDASYSAKIKRLELIPLGNNKAVLILVTDRGYVESNKIMLPEDMGVDDLKLAVTMLDELLRDTPISKIDETLYQRAHDGSFDIYLKYHKELISVLVQTFTQMAKDKYFVSGQSQMMNLPEFQDVNKVKQLFESIEREDILKVVPTGSNDISVRIGSDNSIQMMKDCTVISVPYELNDGSKGAIAIIGPTRMEYDKVIPILEYIAGNVKKVI